MDEATHYWLKRVANKLYELHKKGISFNSHEHMWIYDWDSRSELFENIDGCNAEDRALKILSDAGAIKSERKENFYRNQQHEASEDPLRGGIIWSNWDKFPPAKKEHSYIHYIDEINWERFEKFCMDNQINYEQTRELAYLTFLNQIPIVKVGSRTYVLNILQSGTTLDIIEQAYKHPDTLFGFEELRIWTAKSFVAQNRFTDIFRRGKNVFSSDGALASFAEIKSQSFRLKSKTYLNTIEIEKIRKAANN